MFETTRPTQKSRKSRCSSADHAEVRPGSAAAASSRPSVSSSEASSSAVTFGESAWESNPPRNVLRPVNGFEDRGTHRSPRTLSRAPRRSSIRVYGESSRAAEEPPDRIGAHRRYEGVADAGIALETRRNPELLQRLRETRAALEPSPAADGVPVAHDVGGIRIGFADTNEGPHMPESSDVERFLVVPEGEVPDAEGIGRRARRHGVRARRKGREGEDTLG